MPTCSRSDKGRRLGKVLTLWGRRHVLQFGGASWRKLMQNSVWSLRNGLCKQWALKSRLHWLRAAHASVEEVRVGVKTEVAVQGKAKSFSWPQSSIQQEGGHCVTKWLIEKICPFGGPQSQGDRKFPSDVAGNLSPSLRREVALLGKCGLPLGLRWIN